MGRRGLLACAVAIVLSACSNQPTVAAQERGDPITEVRDSDPEMNAAIAEAKKTLPEFLAALAERPDAPNLSFKYPLGGYEHIWVQNPRREGDTLVGRLANAPVQEGYELGQEVTVPLADVSDWTYRRPDGVTAGHRTTRVLLPRLDPAVAARLRAAYGWKD